MKADPSVARLRFNRFELDWAEARLTCDGKPIALAPKPFWLRPDLKVAERSVFTWPGYAAGRDLYEEVMQSLVEFAEEHPEAVPRMRGRTFARAVH
jgi:hypothetical protein